MTKINRRYELKCVAPETELAEVRSLVRLHSAGFRRAYAPRRVNSIYLDTPGNRNMAENLAGVPNRQKLRLRWYGKVTHIVQNPVLEQKIKEGHVGHKQQQKLDCILDLTDSWVRILQLLRTAVSSQFLPVLKNHTQPTMLNSYQREYFVTHDGQVRLTVDYDQMVFDQRLSQMPNWKRPLPIEKELVIEVKAPPEQANRLNDIMGRFPLRRSRNSKYIKGMLTGPR